MPDRPLLKKQRLACDRCHSQKLRCPKLPGRDCCSRCERIGAVCVFSFSKRAVRTALGRNSSTESEETNGVSGVGTPANNGVDSAAVSFDYSVLPPRLVDPLTADVSQVFLPEIELPDVRNGNGFSTSSGSESSQQPSTTDSSGVDTPAGNEPAERHALLFNHFVSAQPPFNSSRLMIKSLSRYKGAEIERSATPQSVLLQLSDLSLDLIRHAATIPSRDHMRRAREQINNMSFEGIETEYAMDDSFNLSQSLIDIYPKFFESFLSSQPAEEPFITPPSADFRNKHSQSAIKGGSVDTASIYLLISCHQRLIEIWSRCLNSTLANIKASGVYDSSGRLLGLREMKCIGSDAIPISLVRMMLMLMSQFVSQLYQWSCELQDKLKQADRAQPAEPVDEGGIDAFGVVMTVTAHLKQEGEKVERKMNELRQLALG